MDHARECTYKVCGYNNRELHKMLRKLHTGNQKTCSNADLNVQKDKELQEMINQYNLKTQGRQEG